MCARVCLCVCMRVCTRERDEVMPVYMHLDCFIPVAWWWMLSEWCANTERQRGTPVSGFMTEAVQWKVPFALLVPSVTAKASPNPIHSSELWPGQLLQLSKEGSGFNSIRLWKWIGLVFFLYFLFVKERKRENKTQKLTFSLVSFPSTLSPISLYLTLPVGIELFVQLPLID